MVLDRGVGDKILDFGNNGKLRNLDLVTWDQQTKSWRQQFLGEAIMVFILMYVVLETAVNKKNKANAALAPVAIGFAVYIGHTMLIPVDGCSLNPTRSCAAASCFTVDAPRVDGVGPSGAS